MGGLKMEHYNNLLSFAFGFLLMGAAHWWAERIAFRRKRNATLEDAARICDQATSPEEAARSLRKLIMEP